MPTPQYPDPAGPARRNAPPPTPEQLRALSGGARDEHRARNEVGPPTHAQRVDHTLEGTFPPAGTAEQAKRWRR